MEYARGKLHSGPLSPRRVHYVPKLVMFTTSGFFKPMPQDGLYLKAVLKR